MPNIMSYIKRIPLEIELFIYFKYIIMIYKYI